MPRLVVGAEPNENVGRRDLEGDKSAGMKSRNTSVLTSCATPLGTPALKMVHGVSNANY